MSIFSDHAVGALSDFEFEQECRRMNREDRYYEAMQSASMYYHDDDECDEDCEHCTWTECPEVDGITENHYSIAVKRDMRGDTK